MGDNSDLARTLREFPAHARVQGFHNTVHRRGKTCAVCRGPLLNSKPLVCSRCRDAQQTYGSRAADRLGSVIYGGKGLASGDLMHRYKESQAHDGDVLLVTALAALAFRHHACVGSLAKMPPQHWATVPSLRRIGTEHPLRTILLQLLGQKTEIQVAAVLSAHRGSDSQRREINPEFHDVVTPVPHGSHVLLIDDTWVSGGHAQSVAIALKDAGAQQVSVLAIARWVDLQKPYPRWTYNNIIEPEPFAMDICPWTGRDCPQAPPAAANEIRYRPKQGLCDLHNIALAANGECGDCAQDRPAPASEIRSKPKQLICNLHNIALAANGECVECAKLIKKGKRRKPWYQFW